MKKKLRALPIPLLIFILSELLFLLFQARGIFGGDSGDLVTAAFGMGIPHPPGYPLYTFLGWLASHVPVFTPAWRVGLLSSIPHAIAVSLVYSLIVRLTKRPIIGFFTAVALAGNYVFFLYSVTPEVFALFDLFIVLLLYLLVVWKQTGKSAYLNWSALVFGLSLAHHHIILFFVPAIAYWVWINKKLLSFSFHSLIRLSAYFFIGLLPYLYVPVAARGNAIINWDRPVDVAGFIRLVSRADYGTFVSGGFYGAQLVERFLQVQGYMQLLLVDLTWIGVALAVIGGIFLWKTNRQFFFFLALAIFFLGPGFFFYASFPLFNRFNWGTYERFLLPSYMVWYILLGLGFHFLLEWIHIYITKRLRLHQFALIGLALVLFIYPISLLGVTTWRFIGLPQDQTAQSLGVDILSGVPRGSIIILGRDTPLFTTQYVRYVLGVRPDIVLLHAGKLSSPEYPIVIAKNFPQLTVPTTTAVAFAGAFIKANSGRYPIFTNSLFPLEKGWFWVPYGLLYQLTPEASLPSMDVFYQSNRRLWDQFHDPTKGILRRYNHLMLSDVRDVYASSRIEFGKTLLKAGKLDSAREELSNAIAYGGDTQVSDAYALIGLSQLFANHCREALDAFARARATSMVEDKALTLYEGVTYRDCSGDPTRAQKLFDAYERLRKKEEIPLQ